MVSGPKGELKELPTRPRSKKPTIVDVSVASGVSVTTVSRILNDKPDVAAATRERVLRVMDEIGFAPQSAWQQIRSGRTGLIALHFPQDFNPPAHDVIMTAALGLEDAGYSINIVTKALSDSELLGIFRSRQADGIILLEVLTDDRRAELLRDHGYPFVMIGHREDNTGMSFVDVDVQHGIDLALEHLADLGHRRIGFVGIDPAVGNKRYGYATWTLDAYERTCERLGLSAVSAVGGLTAEDVSLATGRLLDAHADISAFIALQEQSVIGLLKTARARGLRSPDELSIVGMVSEPMAEIATPPLTTISFPADEMGRTGARLLLERMGLVQSVAEQVLVRPELTVRDSTARPSRS